LKARVKKVIIGIVGMFVLLAGIAMIVLPGPAFLVIPAAFAILATEFAWAERYQQRAKQAFRDARARHQRKKQERKQAFSV
jgi:uncharacterized protein (TIGR02611 family)